ncbi:MAG: type I restriction-modification enzyme R subunit C-terminal domain-containing protein, partial [Bacteroidota bacterium]
YTNALSALERQDFDPKLLPSAYLCDPKPGHAFVYVSTIQRMAINLFGHDAVFDISDESIDNDAGLEDIPIHAFDIIIADECHRGYTSQELSLWRRTLDHFDAIKIGLTATPASHTTSYFNEVVYRYEYERAVREGYLVDYDIVKIRSEVRMHGIFLNEGDAVGTIDPTTGVERMDLLEDQRQFDVAEIEAKVTSPDSNRKILEEIKAYADQHQERYGRFPKTLIFAVNDLPHTSHADQLVDIARDVFGKGDAFVQKITGRVDRPLQRIREFRNRQSPGVVVSVDMLTTGVDIPDLEFIVFLRPVKSRILFEQMLGRGTRKGEHYPDKSHFTVFDCFDGTLMEYFRSVTGMTTELQRKESRTIEAIIEDIWANRDRTYNISCLVKRLRRVEKEMSGEARDLFAAYIPDGDLGTWAGQLTDLLNRAFTGTMKILRDPGFQQLLKNFPRSKDGMVVAYPTRDIVTSELIIRDPSGAEIRPADYLRMFADYVTSNQTVIDAIRILMDRPQEWSPAVLVGLRATLRSAPQHFTEDQLRLAHQRQHHKALVDIISMVKHAADNAAPLLTANERVDAAFASVAEGKSFTQEQRAWLDRIREHMVQNLSIESEDFDLMPIFTHAGGWGRAAKVFDGTLPALLQNFNRAVAS